MDIERSSQVDQLTPSGRPTSARSGLPRPAIRRWFCPPYREYALIVLLIGTFGVDFVFHTSLVLWAAALAVLPTVGNALAAAQRRRVTIDVFNTFAIAVSFATGEIRSAGFIALMLASARLLEWRTESRTRDAVEELMRLQPLTAVRERDGCVEAVPVGSVAVGDTVVVLSGERIPIDGVVADGTAYVNEAPVTGEFVSLEKIPGDRVVGATLVETGMLKIRVTAVGEDSTFGRMAALMREAAGHKSHSEKLADRFAAAFLPLVGALGAITYLVTGNLTMTAALFLVACADDMAVAIPLAMAASLGRAAERGIIVKGGEWLDALARMRTLVLDKTGTLTYGSLTVRGARLAEGVDEGRFWRALATVEKYSEHPVGRAAYREAMRRVGRTDEPDEFRAYRGAGVWVRTVGEEIVAGTERLFAELGLAAPAPLTGAVGSVFWVAANGKALGAVEVADVPRPEAAESLRQLRASGVSRIIMLTGDSEQRAADIARQLGIEEYRASMTPEAKLRALEELLPEGPVGMVGDGINDAPALARADVGIAMGSGGTAVSVEAADVVIMADDLSRLPELVALGRRTGAVIRSGTIIWALTNVIGFALVLSGLAGPALASFYNFATDFLPLLNSSRLFNAPRRWGRLRA